MAIMWGGDAPRALPCRTPMRPWWSLALEGIALFIFGGAWIWLVLAVAETYR